MRRLLVASLLLLAVPLSAQAPPLNARPSFAEFLDGVRAEALQRGIREEIVTAALGDVTEPLPVVIERDRAQAETVLPLETYIRSRVTGPLVQRGRLALERVRGVLEKVSTEYGVPVRIIAGIWGIESNFGGFSGVRPTVNALATLAWDPRRAAFFRGELFSALEILNRGDIDLTKLRGSWAGAMGQPQFMPSSYLQFAQDFDGDGRRDIWDTPGDVFASIANYLRGHGWVRDQGWGREVRIPRETASRIMATEPRRAGGCQATRDMTVAKPLDAWRELGVRTLDGSQLPKSSQPASLITGASRYFLTYPNYDAILAYNCAHAYAVSVVVLGERIVRPAPQPRTPARH